MRGSERSKAGMAHSESGRWKRSSRARKGGKKALGGVLVGLERGEYGFGWRGEICSADIVEHTFKSEDQVKSL